MRECRTCFDDDDCRRGWRLAQCRVLSLLCRLPIHQLLAARLGNLGCIICELGIGHIPRSYGQQYRRPTKAQINPQHQQTQRLNDSNNKSSKIQIKTKAIPAFICPSYVTDFESSCPLSIVAHHGLVANGRTLVCGYSGLEAYLSIGSGSLNHKGGFLDGVFAQLSLSQQTGTSSAIFVRSSIFFTQSKMNLVKQVSIFFK